MMGLDMTVLVVDNSPPMRRVIKGVLRQIGFKKIIEADDGSMALQELRKEKADLIVSDWDMPKMNGLELLKAVRSDEDLKDIPFIMITAEVGKENVLEAINAGVSGYITKPFTLDTVSKRVKKIFKPKGTI
jgi:two-component system chemotaxis response regulator CheY